jgi:protein-tyrosine-phosphatase
VLTALGKKGDFKDGVLKVNIPRSDLPVAIGGRPAPTPFGFGGWIALTKGTGGTEVMMGDLVLTEDEVNPVMSALLDNGLEVTALHNHFFREQPRIFYMHVHGMGTAEELTRGTSGHRPAHSRREHQRPHGPQHLGRVRRDGCRRDADAMVAGDVAMLEPEVTPVLTALRASGIDVVAIHHHMTEVKPVVIFLHYFSRGPAETLARGVRAALDRLGTPLRATKNVLFICPHGAARSVLATAYFKNQAQARGLDLHVDSVGTEPDPEVAPSVVKHLEAQGYEVPISKPRLASAGDLASADIVVAMGCDLTGRTVRGGLRSSATSMRSSTSWSGPTATEACRRRSRCDMVRTGVVCRHGLIRKASPAERVAPHPDRQARSRDRESAQNERQSHPRGSHRVRSGGPRG